ncbi:LpqB family beta-propeller domain-containing protein [Actinomycetospora termitidis]|uniref:LpqB family beta-propeller domain-containing protein n=1 Tax=Actinomycetospora termitidis TaxID=3053470 RepID=A0ABT7M926_9PSEU|nr:LpqB family beta-propeller domain-containing protein [Actinomycetospora sp. Odt1-22]MDL5157180.1 LpqB family beta-propeller domain-containing protein [Actinomycetospora sp. Odt1-22]
MSRSRLAAVLGLIALLLVGCATVPGSSDVSVLRRVGDPAEPSAPSGPARGAGPLEIVRGWILASGATAERHSAARAFLGPAAAGGWDDGASPTVVSDRVDTVFEQGNGQSEEAVVRIRADKLGTLRPDGAFVAAPGLVDLTVRLTATNGVWRISGLPPGTIVRRADLRANTRPVRIWFLAPVGGAPVSETRYLATSPARSVSSRVLDELLSGPSDDLRGAALSALPPGALLRSAVGTTPDGVTTVDLTRVGPVEALDAARRTEIAQQIVLTLAGVGVDRVALTVDGEPLLEGRGELGVADVLAGLPPSIRERRDLPGDGPATPAPAPSPAVVTTGGRVLTVPESAGTTTTRESSPDLVTGVDDARSASLSPDGRDVAVVGFENGVMRLFVGRSGAAVTPTTVVGRAVGQPSWSPDGTEVWTVVDGVPVRAVRGPDSSGTVTPVALDTTPLTGLGPPTALRLSPDGTKVALVSDGRVVIATVVRDPGGGARLGSVRVLRPGPVGEALGGVLDVAWAQTDRLVAVGTAPGLPVQTASVDGLELDSPTTTNLTPPVTAVAAASERPVLVVDQGGLWSLPASGGDVWSSVPGGSNSSVPSYPG